MKSLVLSLAILTASSAALAQPTAPVSPAVAPDDPAQDATFVAPEVTVTAQAQCLDPKSDPSAPPPKIISTYPADGAVVRPGVLVVRVTLDQPMSCKGFFKGAMAPLLDPCPKTAQSWVMSYDRRTIRTVCRADANNRYGLRLSDAGKSLMVSLAGAPLAPYAFTFSVSAQTEVRTIQESLAEDPDGPLPAPSDVPIKIKELGFKH